jgi:hypothetical protein
MLKLDLADEGLLGKKVAHISSSRGRKRMGRRPCRRASSDEEEGWRMRLRDPKG